jgi:hypothetical protein
VTERPSAKHLLVHNLDAVLAVAALPLFAATGLPAEGWFWAVALWAVNRFLAVAIERRAKELPALRAVGVMGASMLLRPWIGMLVLFLITRHDAAMALSATLLFVVVLTVDIATRVVVHKNVSRRIGRPA